MSIKEYALLFVMCSAHCNMQIALHKAGSDGLLALQMWLQDPAWTEEEKPGKLAARMERAQGKADREKLAKQPMFCVETAIKLHRRGIIGAGCTIINRLPSPHHGLSMAHAKAVVLAEGSFTQTNLSVSKPCHFSDLMRAQTT